MGLDDDNLLVLGKGHIKTIRLPIHPMILQFLFALQIHPMQLTPNSLKFIVATIILKEVEGKNIKINDLLFTFNVKKTPSKPGNPRQYLTYYLSGSKNYFMFSRKLVVNKDWETTGGLYLISGDWIPKDFDRSIFLLVTRFTQTVSPAANVQISQERIYTLRADRVFHFSASRARDTDSICNAQAMKCLTGPPEAALIKELHALIHKLEEVAQKKSNSKAEKNSSKSPEQAKHGDKGKGKMLTDSLPSLVSEEEEQEIVPLIIKRKRSNPSSRTKNSSTPQVSSAFASDNAAVLSSAAMKSGPTPNPDEDDHLTIKRLKFQHSQSSGLSSFSSVQTPSPIQPTTHVQSTIPSIILASFPVVVDIEDSDEEQGLQVSIFDKISSPSIQTTITPTPSRVEQPE